MLERGLVLKFLNEVMWEILSHPDFLEIRGFVGAGRVSPASATAENLSNFPTGICRFGQNHNLRWLELRNNNSKISYNMTSIYLGLLLVALLLTPLVALGYSQNRKGTRTSSGQRDLGRVRRQDRVPKEPRAECCCGVGSEVPTWGWEIIAWQSTVPGPFSFQS